MIKVIRIFYIVVNDLYVVVKDNYFFNKQVNHFSWLFQQSFVYILYYIFGGLGQDAFLIFRFLFFREERVVFLLTATTLSIWIL